MFALSSDLQAGKLVFVQIVRLIVCLECCVHWVKCALFAASGRWTLSLRPEFGSRSQLCTNTVCKRSPLSYGESENCDIAFANVGDWQGCVYPVAR